jgi:riboflavin biosynthesis pyrimidine reductase
MRAIESELLALEAGVEVWRAPECGPGDPCIGGASLAMLADRGINDVLLESGPTLLDAFHDAELLDALHCYVAPIDAPGDQPGLASDHPLVGHALASTPEPSGDDDHHHAILHPAWTFPGATIA